MVRKQAGSEDRHNHDHHLHYLLTPQHYRTVQVCVDPPIRRVAAFAKALIRKPAAYRCCRLMGQTDGRTPDRYKDPALHSMRAASTKRVLISRLHKKATGCLRKRLPCILFLELPQDCVCQKLYTKRLLSDWFIRENRLWTFFDVECNL